MKTIYTHEDMVNGTRKKVLYRACPDEYVWVIARPENAKNLIWRIKAAFEVLKGRAVPLEWF